ncbi:hypothetical protein GE061_005820 [Apolygus lucorum]|uniref:Uncharacterized protein n=1 Tax=Apolygus lucorum TaxID=248454 RepID=A0A6A4ITK4_APOLU|nr:hypothetical protein GE061_005820 [Apolygus lucorum]
MFIRRSHFLTIVLSLCVHFTQCQYDFSETQALWDLTLRATSLTSNIAKNSFKVTSKLLNVAAGSKVRDFLIFLKTRANRPPQLNGAEIIFDDGSRLNMSEGVMVLGNNFRVRIEPSRILGVDVHCTGIPVKIYYKNLTYADANGDVMEGSVIGSIKKLDITYQLSFTFNCPLRLDSIIVNSIGRTKVEVGSRSNPTFKSPMLTSFLGKLPKSWEQEIPKSLRNHLRLNPFGRGIMACNESNVTSQPSAASNY